MRRFGTVLALTSAAWLGTVAAAFAAHPQKGARYMGNSGACAASIKRQCVFLFRVSGNGETLQFVKSGQAISSWACHGGGGEAIFGSEKNDYRIPTARIRSNGTFAGSKGQGARKLLVTGHFTGSGKTAVLKFTLPNQGCHAPSLKLMQG
jgi:hypothetical protein